MKKLLIPLVLFTSALYSQTLKTTLVKGKDIVTGGDYLDGQYISQDSAPEESGYIKGFYVSDLITQEFYESITGKNPSKVVNPKAPVTDVTMKDILNFCEKLSKKEFPNISSRNYHPGDLRGCDLDNKGYRLPLEEEWELALKSNAIKATNILERTISLKNTKTMRFGLSDENKSFEFPYYKNYVFRGNNSAVKREFHNSEFHAENCGFRVVRPDMTEWGFPAQKTVPAGVKADTSINDVEKFIEKAIKNTAPDADGLIHINLVIAEELNQTENTTSIDKLFKVIEKYSNLRVNLDLKNCVFKVPENIYFLENMNKIGFWRKNQLESVILPDDCESFGITECENVKYVQTNTLENISLNTFDECPNLKYVFVPRKQESGDEVPDITLNTGVKTQVIWNSTAKEYKEKHDDFDKPVERNPEPTECKVTFNHKAMYYGDTLEVEIEIPENQIKKQEAVLILVYQKNRKFELDYRPFKINGKSNKCLIKKIDSGEFYWPENNDDDEILVCPIIKFEDGTVYEFYETKILIVG